MIPDTMSRFLLGMSLVFLVRMVYCYDDEELETEEFIPTSEWQEVKPGQSIPPGLHVRLDLEKGGKWAKLMDSKQDSDIKSIVIKDTPSTKEKKAAASKKIENYKVEELKAALKKMKDDKRVELKTDDEQKVKDRFRSMDEIKSAFEELNLNQENDFDAMTRLLKQYQSSKTADEEKLLALQDLENYVHQVDNAVDFAKIDGMAVMVSALNSSDPGIRQEAAHVIGSAVQSNPAVQVKAVEAGALASLIRIVADVKQHSEVRKKALYAVSCLIRHFPAAQYFFKNAGGFTALRSCFNEHGTEKLQLKALSLINDLAVERKEHFADDSSDDDERIRQYKLFSLSTMIGEMGLCSDMMRLVDTEQHDQRDMLLTVMKNLHGICKTKTDYVSKVKDTLKVYKSQYRQLSAEEEKEGDDDSFFHLMYKNVNELLELIDGGHIGVRHIEL